MGSAASVSWSELGEDLTEEEVRNILGANFDQNKFDEKKDASSNTLSKEELKKLITSHEESNETNEIETSKKKTSQESSATNKDQENTSSSSSSSGANTTPQKNNKSPAKKKESKTSPSPKKIGIQLPDVARRNAKVRNRSFENGDCAKDGSKGNNAARKRVPRAMSLESVPTKQEDTTEQQEEVQVDSWESVQAQPSCIVCGMVFSSLGKLETHKKYSSVHVANLKKQAEKDLEKKEVSGIGAQEEESNRCRVLYTGSKHFWRTNDHLDINIYLHIEAKCVEVIAYESKLSFEFPRIYLDETKLLAMIKEDTVWDNVKKIEEDASRKKLSHTLPSREVLFAEEKRLLLASFVLNRLKISAEAPSSMQVSASEGELVTATKGLLASQSEHLEKLGLTSPGKSGSPFFTSKRLQYCPSSMDSEQQVDFDFSTAQVKPVLVQRRRHSTDQEIHDAMTSLSEMQDDIRGMTDRAEGIANMVHRGVDRFNARVRGSLRRQNSLSLARRRWIFAINRVIRQREVKLAKVMLSKYGDKFYVEPEPEA